MNLITKINTALRTKDSYCGLKICKHNAYGF